MREITDGINRNLTTQQFEQLKVSFQKDIDSKRTFSRIQNLEDLIKVLYKRDCDLKILFEKIKKYIPHECNTPQTTAAPIQTVLTPVPTDLTERIDHLIATEIGQKWQDFARALTIPEGKIDEFNVRYPQLERIVLEILRYHRSRTPLWKTSLCEALQKARRTDLSLEVHRLIEMQSVLSKSESI